MAALILSAQSLITTPLNLRPINTRVKHRSGDQDGRQPVTQVPDIVKWR